MTRPLIVVPMGALAIALAGCGGPSDTSTPAASTKGAPTQTHQESTDFANIPGQFATPPTLTANGEALAPVGACADLTGTTTDAILSIVDCNSPQNTYRVVRRVNVPQECGDTDRSYYHNAAATGQFTACLDLAWDATSCLSLGQPVTKVACDDRAAPNKIKPINVILDTTTLAGCPQGGYPHPARRFTICTQTVG